MYVFAACSWCLQVVSAQFTAAGVPLYTSTLNMHVVELQLVSHCIVAISTLFI